MKGKKLLVISVVVVLLGTIFAIRILSIEAFTTDKWTNATPEMRDRLLDSLARGGRLIGLTEAEVTTMLGTPDGSSPSRGPYLPKIWYTRRYYSEDGELKKRRAGISRCLYLRFRDGRVEKAEFVGS